MSGHLGPLAAALVDEQLDNANRDRALRHIASCANCRFEVEQQRAVKVRLDGLGEPMLPSALFDKLQAMRVPPTGEQPAPQRPPSERPPTERPPTGQREPSDPLPPPLPLPLASPVRHRVRRVLVGATSLVLLGGGAAYAAGGSPDQSVAPVRPAVDVYTVQHGTTSGTVPLNDPAVSAVTVGLGR